MRLRNLKIGTQLRIGFGAILALVLALGALAWLQTDLLWSDTKDLYDHPLQVRRAVGGLEADIQAIHLGMKDLCLAETDLERQAVQQKIDEREADAHRWFQTLYDRYLGPRGDVDDAHRAFARWQAIRDDTRRLLREGKIKEAADRTKTGGVGGDQANELLVRVRKISDFAAAKGDEFYSSATQRNESLNRQLGLGIGVILLLALGVAYLLQKAIRDPLQELTAVAGQFRQGKLEARVRYASASELGTLAAAFNALADATQAELTFRQRVAELNVVMVNELETGQFRQQLLEALMRATGSEVGAIYVLDEPHAAYQHLESIGLGRDARASFSAAEREGELGAALASGKIQHLAEIPEDTRFAFVTVSGDFRPRAILTLPLGSGSEVPAMISLASVRGYDPAAIRLAEELLAPLSTWMSSMLASRKLKALMTKLEQQNSELEAQTRELTTQADELGQQNAELEQQKRELDQANRLKSSFLSNMSHELRTPLNSVIALSGVLGRRLAKTIPTKEHGYLEVIERNGRHLLSLINDVLDLARIEAGREELTSEAFSIKDLAAELVAMLEHQAREKQIVLASTVPDDLPLVRSDRTKCRHVLQNLLSNAVKFTDVGRVEISARATASALCISVTDTGIGIAADRLELIFEEFRQADESTARKYGGTGLGLAIARKYAGLLQGALEVKSTPGKGSTFTLTLPLVLGADAGPHPHSRAHAGTRSLPISRGDGQRILLVDDNEPAIIQLNDVLAGQGYEVRAAHSGREALTQMEAWLPDAVILDLMMPGVDGFEVLRLMRSAERTAGVPVLILTAKHVTKEELSFLKGNHIHQLIQKGDVDRAELLSAVAAMVPRRPASDAPAAASLPAPGARRRGPSRPRRPGKPLVLVVEDNPDNLMTARAVLEDLYDVIEAADGKAGVAQALAHRPDVVLMDISLPVMDGIHALGALRAEESLGYLPVIALTASAMKGNREEILAHGFDGYVAKPIDAQVLLQAIKGVLDVEA
jgi:signal transduction histidine kinase/DNA-binding response OmpR family regulator/HAMP domain-containing protein